MVRRLTSLAGGLTLPPRSVRVRFTALYGVVLLLSGIALPAIANLATTGWSVTRPVRSARASVPS